MTQYPMTVAALIAVAIERIERGDLDGAAAALRSAAQAHTPAAWRWQEPPPGPKRGGVA